MKLTKICCECEKQFKEGKIENIKYEVNGEWVESSVIFPKGELSHGYCPEHLQEYKERLREELQKYGVRFK